MSLKDFAELPYTWVLVVYAIVVLFALFYAAVRVRTTEKTEPFDDYGLTQRRDVLLSHTGADERSLATKIADAVAHKKEQLVASNNGQPAFWDGGLYNMEGKVKDGAIDAGRGGESFRERMDDSELMERFDDSELLQQN